jgi:transcriptional regulator EpsA
MSTQTEISVTQSRSFGDLISESIEIKTHSEFLSWAQGTLQEFLPHELMISAWGDFSLGIIYYDIISPIPGARTNIMPEKDMTLFLKRLYNYWISKDRTPSQLLSDRSVIRCRDIQDGQLKKNLQNMNSALLHAIKDVRGGSDSFYVLLSSNADIPPSSRRIFHQLLPYIDATLRQIEYFPDQTPESHSESSVTNESAGSIQSATKLSEREAQIMGWVCSGKTNVEIGLILDISSFTVKNHLQRIFKKLDVVNRSQAVAKIRGQVTAL